EGREIYIGVLGNDRLTTFPAWEMIFGSLPNSAVPIATRKVKWDREYQAKYDIITRAADDLPPAVLDNLSRMSKRIYKALHLSGYARMDFRVRADGSIFVLEANANPNLARDEDFAESARSMKMSYDELLGRVMSLGLNYQAAWRTYES